VLYSPNMASSLLISRQILVPFFVLAACSVFAGEKPAWTQHGGNAQHTAVSQVPMQKLEKILWQSPVDKVPQYSGSSLLTHYMSPLFTNDDTIVMTVKTTATGGFVIEGRKSQNGKLKYSFPTDWTMPPAGWKPVCGTALVPNARNRRQYMVAVAAAGGRVIIRESADDAVSKTKTICFFGEANYKANPASYNAGIAINTPLTVDNEGNIYFGFQAIADTPLHLKSGVAKINYNGSVSYTSISAATGGSSNGKVPTNSAPGISNDGKTLYFATNEGTPYLVGVATSNLSPKYKVRMTDPTSGNDALILDLGTASPMIAPDNSVFFGILENPFPANHDRGWMLHFSGALNQINITGNFGWDNTASIVPRSAVPSYRGTSPYLIFSKYNDYYGIGGAGHNRIAVLDPFATQTDPVTNATIMKEVITVLAPTHDPGKPADAVTEWCINSAAIDPSGKCALVNCEDGKAYRYDFKTNTLSQTVTLTAGLGEAYTPSVIGPDGRGYCINNGILFCIGSR